MNFILLVIFLFIPFSLQAKNCSDFGTQKEAQAWYEQRKKSGQTGWKSLDHDGDSKACDCLPGGNGKNYPKKK
ncbi:excalibur calcium-binding domain-containing protein [Acinetobacter courvalinii]|uniref:Excalibur calcium-binding domain-containing protein n=1 Tax=Acinetobacter courvalinii TaxID=280147 RepID=A0ABD0A4W5_9GAMM|nr:excalibur calcium-binding domain-containing protein [Acinetobacter courvalinii]KAB0658367.1 hypothetical protein F7P77_11725 [Acinetobacter courvalinii]RSN84240.1 hypothetical protein EA770_01380 [Acinetobacter baumannii]GGH30040.1 hypothetical protein GCM10007354_09880 [Acinetobacter courvalinii]